MRPEKRKASPSARGLACQRLAHKQHSVLSLLGPSDHVGRSGQVKMLVGPKSASGAEASLNLVEDQGHVVDERQEAQPPEEPRRRHANAAFSLDRLDEHRRHMPCALERFRANPFPLGFNEGRQFARPGQEGVYPREFLCESLATAASAQDFPDLSQAALFAALGCGGGGRIVHREDRLRPVEGREPQAGFLAMRDRKRAEGASVESAIKRDNMLIPLTPVAFSTA